MSKTHAPKAVEQVMVSSTFTDLKEHRALLIDAIYRHNLYARAMENDSAGLDDVIESSLKMVRESAAYICLIGFKYGQIPPCPKRNPDDRSITELEFDEALRLKRPILLFLIGKQHPILFDDVEPDSTKRAKLEAFRERAKQIGLDTKLHRIYAEFSNLSDFERKIAPSLARVKAYLDSRPSAPDQDVDSRPEVKMASDGSAPSSIPHPPAFYAKPDYLPGHAFVGRKAQCEELSDWASADNPINLLLFHAIGGNGKSMLTWQWTTRFAPQARDDWAGRFWYSFYEQGAVMADFCRHALAYMTDLPLEAFEKLKTLQMRDELLAQLKARPWLLVLDGLERVLVAYHRIDAAELADESGENPTDAIASRNACDTIRDEDGDLLRALAQAAPSKILATSRLTPRVLLNAAGQDIPGVRCKPLDGLLADDAEALFHASGVRGDRPAIRRYLGTNCGNHPLVVGVIAGLVNDYLPDRGNFDAWLVDPAHGAKLDLGQLDLIQRRNHILKAAIAALPEDSAAVLSQLALLQEAVDYPTLQALNPLLPPAPKPVEQPEDPKLRASWQSYDQSRQKRFSQQYAVAVARYEAYLEERHAWARSPDVQHAPQRLDDAIRDLERRGLLQYEYKRHNLHPVVRSVAFAETNPELRLRQGEKAVDHFTSRPHRPYAQVETLEEMAPALQAIRVCLRLGMSERAAAIYVGDVGHALHYNLEAFDEMLEILQPFFPDGWGEPSAVVDDDVASYLATVAGHALSRLGKLSEAEMAYRQALSTSLARENWMNVVKAIRSFSRLSEDMRMLHRASRLDRLSYSLAMASDLDAAGYAVALDRLNFTHAKLGLWGEILQPDRKPGVHPAQDIRALYRPGDAEYHAALFAFWHNEDPSPTISRALALTREGQNRLATRRLHTIQGNWHIQQHEWRKARDAYDEAVRLARERNLIDEWSETGLALAKHHLGELPDPQEEAQRLAQFREPAHYHLALLWQAIGYRDQAAQHARAAYRDYWGEGEPYVRRYWLDSTIELLHALDEPIPQLPPFDPAKVPPYPWEAEVQAAIDRLNAKKAAEAASAANDGEAPASRD
ncbi:MAG: DUF4062 domain-containing protein [Pseudomonadota bacterium]